MAKEIFNSKETLLAAGEIITLGQNVSDGKITSLDEIKNESIRKIVKNGMKYHKNNATKIGGVVGVLSGSGLGVASGYGLISLMAAEGTVGAAVVTSGLATIGSLFGGGMMAGIGVLLVIPAALAAVGGIIGIILASKSKKTRDTAKKKLLVQAEKTLSKLKSKIAKLGESNSEFEVGVLLSLQALVNDLKRDIN